MKAFHTVTYISYTFRSFYLGTKFKTDFTKLCFTKDISLQTFAMLTPLE